MQLKDKQVVITGGTGGIGSLLCKELIDAGAKVTAINRPGEEVPEGIKGMEGELSSFEGITKVAQQLQELPIDILINMAGLQYFGLCEEQKPEHTMLLYTVNLIAPALLTQAVLPQMKQRGSGQIVAIGSTFGSINFAHFTTYSSSKAGLRGFAEALRREVKGDGIDVTYIAPRAVKTPFNTKEILEFGRITKMNMDEPEWVAKRIAEAIIQKKKDVFLGFPEKLFVRLNAIAPRLVDGALAGNDLKAKKLFIQPRTE